MEGTMADFTLREELEKIFERLNEFSHLGERNGFDEDLARIPKLHFAKQILDAFKPKTDEAKKRREAEKWLKENLIAAGLNTTAGPRSKVSPSKEVELVPDWNNYVKFKEAYALLVRRLLTDLNKLAGSQKWLDAEGLANVVNQVNLREMWRVKEKNTKAHLMKALATLL
jgi:hypothetical protein